MDRQELKETLRKSSRKAGLTGELKVSKDEKPITILPPDWFEHGPGGLAMAFGERASSGALENGIAFVISRNDFGKEITFPNGGSFSSLELIYNNEYYGVKSGKLTVYYDEAQKQANGIFEVEMEPGSPIATLTKGTFLAREA